MENQTSICSILFSRIKKRYNSNAIRLDQQQNLLQVLSREEVEDVGEELDGQLGDGHSPAGPHQLGFSHHTRLISGVCNKN